MDVAMHKRIFYLAYSNYMKKITFLSMWYVIKEFFWYLLQ